MEISLTNHYGVQRQFFEEALRGVWIHVEIEGIGWED